jgi:hypothetical protein
VLLTIAVATLIVTTSFVLTTPLLADTVSYSDTKTWQFTSNQDGAVPVLAGRWFTHAISPDGTVQAWDPGGQDASFSGSGTDTSTYLNQGNVELIGLTNGAKAAPISTGLINDLPLGQTPEMSTAGTSSASTTFEVDQKSMTSNGSLTVAGNASDLGYPFSYGGLSATIGGKQITGTVSVTSNNTQLASALIQGFRHKVGVKDPLNLVVTDGYGNVLLSQTLFLFTAEVDGGAQVTWQDGVLTFAAGGATNDANLEIDVTPLGGAPSTLVLQVINGKVAGEKATGIFSSLQLPPPGSVANFALNVQAEFDFNYDLRQFGDMGIGVVASWDTAGYRVLPQNSTQ